MRRLLRWVAAATVVAAGQAQEFLAQVMSAARSRMCQMQPVVGRVEDCLCDFEVADDATRRYFGPLLQNLTRRPFFRYFKVDLDRGCPFFQVEGQCMRRECAIDVCAPSEVPSLWLEEDTKRREWAAAWSTEDEEDCGQFGGVDGGVDRQTSALKRSWHERGGDEVWILQDDDAPGMDYIDLLKNPEKYTGYDGEPARRIWRAVWEENCFKLGDRVQPKEALVAAWRAQEEGTCLERRVFYRLLSGLQASISTHIAKTSSPWWTSGPEKRSVLTRLAWAVGFAVDVVLLSGGGDPPPAGFATSAALTNDALFVDRVGAHSDRVHNLYFTYLFVLRAVTLAGADLQAYDYETGDGDAATTQQLVRDLTFSSARDVDVDCASAAAARAAFDETRLFLAPEDPRMSPLERALARESIEELRGEFVARFRNISRIMDCVTCERCRLWGKLQVLGLGTAIKVIMLQGEPTGLGTLQRNEVVALVNTLAQLAKSVDSVREWHRRDVRRALARTAAAATLLGALLLLLRRRRRRLRKTPLPQEKETTVR